MAFHLALQRALRFADENGAKPNNNGLGSAVGFGRGGGAGAGTSGGGGGSGGGSGVSNGTGSNVLNGAGNGAMSAADATASASNSGYSGFRPSGKSHRRMPSRDLALCSSSSSKQGGGSLEKSVSMGSLPTSKSVNGLCSTDAPGSHDDYAVSIGLLYGASGEADTKRKGGGGGAGDRYNGSKNAKESGLGKETRRAKWCAFCLIAWVVMWLLMGGGISQVKGVPFKLPRARRSRSSPSDSEEVVSADFFSTSDLNAHSARLGNVTVGSGGTHRIVLVTAAYNHIVDGVSMTLNRLVKWLLEQGHEVVVVAPTSPTPMIQHAGNLLEVPSIAVPGRQEYRLSVRLPSAVRTKMTAFNPTLVHIATPDLVGHSAQDWARRHSVPVVCSYHTRFNSYLPFYYLGWLEPWYWYIFRRFNRKCEQMYVPSDTVKTELEAHGVAPDSIRMWSRGVDTATFSPQFRSDAWRRSVGVSDDTPIIVLVSRIVWEKGLDVFVRVIRQLERRGLDFKSVVVGEGPARAAMAKKLPHTVFLGKQTGEALTRAYASSDIYLFPSHTETFGATSLEAMSSGVPVIVAGGPSDSMVRNGTSGFIVSPYSCEACFLEFAETLIRNATLRRSMGEESRRIALESFQWDAVFENLLGHYDEAVSLSITNGTRVT